MIGQGVLSSDFDERMEKTSGILEISLVELVEGEVGSKAEFVSGSDLTITDFSINLVLNDCFSFRRSESTESGDKQCFLRLDVSSSTLLQLPFY